MDEDAVAEIRHEVLRDAAAVAQRVAEAFREAARDAVALRDHFHVGLAGGKTPRGCYTQLNLMKGVPWEHIQLFIGDERAVPLNHELSNYRMVRERLLPDNEALVGRVHHLSTFEKSLEDVVIQYQRLLEEILGKEGIFDLLLLGLRPDGSTAGLLPGRPESRERESLVVAVRNADDGPDRISVGPRAIRTAREIWVIATGREKAEVVRHLLRDAPEPSDCPAAWILRAKGPVRFFLDEASASQLT